MPAITALIHTSNDALRLGRALEILYPCDEVVVIDHDSRDATLHVAREYGCRLVSAKAGALSALNLPSDPSTWFLCLAPTESLSESLAASLFEWKTEHLPRSISSFSVYLREETADGWIANPVAQTRLVPSTWNRWTKMFPENDPTAVTLEGELLRFIFP
jgi:glycosyltransferase involved in cell wall biosynthesis